MTFASPSTVVVRAASAAERPLIEGLFQLYAYDWSEMEPPDSPSFEVDAQGRFPSDPHLDAYWRETNRWPLLIEVGGRTAGFVLLNTHSHRDGGVIERNMGEFFVLRKHRRQGAALAAFHQVLALHPGEWEVAVAQRNVAARAFWERAIRTADTVSDVRTEDGDGQHWRGPIWRFRVARAA
jgi:predicted acetyltransferase